MTILDDAMRKHIEYIVCTEKKPFSFIDFLTFDVGQQHYKMSHGTFRNKISAMLKGGEIELAYYSRQAFYTINGVNFSKQMTPDHTGGTLSSSLSICSSQELRHIKNHPIYRLIQNVPYDKSALHDIRLRTTVNGIWGLFSLIPTLSMNHNSKDILVIKEDINHLNIRVTVHRTDTISVVIGCAYWSVAVDISGVNRLSNALTLIHNRLQRLTKDCTSDLAIPSHMNWIVTMWHFGADASILYKGELFHVSWKVAENALIAFYSKVWKDGKYRIRGERQEYPGKPLDEAFEEKLNLIGGVNKTGLP